MKQIVECVNIEPGEITFEDFYRAYPKKTDKKKAETLWNKLSATKKHLALVDVPERIARHSQWRDRQFIPSPLVYLRNEKWTDEIITARTVEDEQADLEDGTPLGRFWSLIKQTYGNERVKREYGETMPFMWRKALEDLTPKDIAKIINYLMTDQERGLPSLNKIVRIKNIGKTNNQKLLPVDICSKETAQAGIAELKSILRA